MASIWNTPCDTNIWYFGFLANQLWRHHLRSPVRAKVEHARYRLSDIKESSLGRDDIRWDAPNTCSAHVAVTVVAVAATDAVVVVVVGGGGGGGGGGREDDDDDYRMSIIYLASIFSIFIRSYPRYPLQN